MGWQLLPRSDRDTKYAGKNVNIGTDPHDKNQSAVVNVCVSDTSRLKHSQKIAYVALTSLIIMAVTMFIVIICMQYFGHRVECSLPETGPPAMTYCQDACRIQLVESIPENLTYPQGSAHHNSTFAGWKILISQTGQTLDMSAFYWTLQGQDIHVTDPSLQEGEEILNSLVELSNKKAVKVRIAQNTPKKGQEDDVHMLTTKGKAEARTLNFTHLMGNGVLHTKIWVSDSKHVYVGSANMDCRSLTQVKELGAVLQNCPCIAKDLQKVFEAYWYLGAPGATVPKPWPAEYNTVYNATNPMHVTLNNIPARVFISSSPSPFCATGRTADIDAILHVIRSAKKYVHIAVMDYYPVVMFANPRRFWPVIDDALRKVALEKGVEVRVLGSWWKHTENDMKQYLLSLAQLNGAMNHAKIEVKLFHVPAYTEAQKKIPFARVNHNKYMVTDNTAYIGTSNWSGDYFIHTAGVGLVINQTSTDPRVTGQQKDTVQSQLSAIFDRDWNSQYAKNITVSNRKQHSEL